MFRVAAQHLREAATAHSVVGGALRASTSAASSTQRPTRLNSMRVGVVPFSTASSIRQRQLANTSMPSSLCRDLPFGMTAPSYATSTSSAHPAPASTQQLSESHASGASANYLEQMWEEWKRVRRLSRFFFLFSFFLSRVALRGFLGGSRGRGGVVLFLLRQGKKKKSPPFSCWIDDSLSLRSLLLVLLLLFFLRVARSPYLTWFSI
jgi:hypothetical protein